MNSTANIGSTQLTAAEPDAFQPSFAVPNKYIDFTKCMDSHNVHTAQVTFSLSYNHSSIKQMSMQKKIFCPDSKMPLSEGEIQGFIKYLRIRGRITFNRSRGRMGEITSLILYNANIRGKVIIDKQFFATPFGGRRIDNYMPLTKREIESKYTRVVATKKIRNQIEKDSYLLKNGILKEVWWILYFGGSKRVISTLEKNGIQYIKSKDELLKNINLFSK